MANDNSPVIKEIFVEATPEETFSYLTDPEKFLTWMGVSAELQPRAGGSFMVSPNGHERIVGEFVEVSPPRRVVFTWGWDEPEHAYPPGSTRVEIDLVAQGTGTLLRLIHRDLRGEAAKRHADVLLAPRDDAQVEFSQSLASGAEAQSVSRPCHEGLLPLA